MKRVAHDMASLRTLPCTALLAFAAWSNAASGAIIFSDSFSNDGALSGSIPTVRPGTETWTSTSTVAAGALTVGSTTTSYLAWTPSANNIYSLAVDVKSTGTGAGSIYGGMGFFSTAATVSNTYALSGANTPWAFVRTGNGTVSSIGDTSFRPTGATTPDEDTNLTVTNTNRLELILNTNDTDAGTAGIQWSLTFLVNGTQVGATTTYTDVQSAALLANIKSIGVTGATTGTNPVSYDNFVLQTIPEPSHLLLGASSLGLLALRRRK